MRRNKGWGASPVKKLLCTLCVAATVGSALVTGPNLAGATGRTQGVTPTSITIGIPYIDLVTVDRLYGLHLNQGSYPDAVQRLDRRPQRARRHRRTQGHRRLRAGQSGRSHLGCHVVHPVGAGRPRVRRPQSVLRDLLPRSGRSHHQRNGRRNGAGATPRRTSPCRRRQTCTTRSSWPC